MSEQPNSKHAGGRPTKYRKELLEGLPERFAQGQSIEEVCRDMGISRQTFYVWMEKHKQFHDTVKKGLALSEAWWHTLGRAGASGKAQINPAVWIFNMKNRFNWSDRKESKIEVTGKDGAPINVASIINKVEEQFNNDGREDSGEDTQ